MGGVGLGGLCAVCKGAESDAATAGHDFWMLNVVLWMYGVCCCMGGSRGMNDYRIQIAENHVSFLNPYRLTDKGIPA